MSLSNKIRISLLAVGIFLAGWQFQRHLRQGRELASVQAELRSKERELETRREPLAKSEQKYNEVAEAERRAGNQTVLSLMRERAAATKANSEAASESRKIEGALANVLDNPAQQEIDRQALRDKVRSDMRLFFQLTHASPEQMEQFIDLQLEMGQREANRLSALLRGQAAIADALRDRDRDVHEKESRRSAIFGTEGEKFFQSIADGMRNDEAKRLLDGIQQNIGSNTLNPDQSDRLRNLLKTEIAATTLDDTDLFRPAEDWEQYVRGHQQNVLDAAAAFLTPAQLEAIKNLASIDLEMQKEQMLRKRKSLGMN